MPTRMGGGAEGYACYARSCEPLVSGFTRCHLGFSPEVPDGMAALLIPRFSVCDLDNGSMASYGVVIVDGRCRVEVGKTETRRPKWSCAAHGCACGYPFARTGWAVIGHPELTAEATQDVDGNLVIRVI